MLNLWFERLDPGGLEPRHVSVEEGVSSLFQVLVRAGSRAPDLDLGSIVGARAALRLVPELAHREARGRLWSGVCAHAEIVRVEPTGESTYVIRIVPSLWLLTQQRRFRVFQHLSIPQIVLSIFDAWKIEYRTDLRELPYPKLPYKVQYDESDYAFVSRLLEEAGITFIVRDPEVVGRDAPVLLRDRPEDATSRLTLRYVDNPNVVPGHDYATEIALSQEVRPGAHVVRDFDLRRPRMTVEAEAPRAAPPEHAYEIHRYEPGSFVVETAPDGSTPTADDRGAARALEAEGVKRASRALESERAGRRTVSFQTNAADLGAGYVSTLINHPHPDLADKKVLVTSWRLAGPDGGKWRLAGKAVFCDEPYRPPHKTPKPRMHGVESATVVGPPGQEIHTDELGRVRVQFPWDREGLMNDKSSCWIRVSEGWAGAGFGMIALPRVGQEVLVGFLCGDPDQPIIVGRVFNSVNPVPHKLPDFKTRSAWKTASSPHTGGFNEIRFEDRAGQEQVFVHAARDLVKEVLNDERAFVTSDRFASIGNDDVLQAGRQIRAAIAPKAPRSAGVTHWVMAEDLIILTTGRATIALNGPNVEIQAEGDVTVNGAKILLNCDKKG